jgi:hypothetical protein
VDDYGISQGIIANESGGQNLVSPQGAIGPGQIMPGTFAQYARPGEKISNPADNMAVHQRIISDYAQRWPGDPARIATAYFSGPGNVSPPGSPTPWIRNVHDVNENVSKYVSNALSSMPSRPVSPTPGVTLTSVPMDPSIMAHGGVDTTVSRETPPTAAAATTAQTPLQNGIDALKKLVPNQQPQQTQPQQQGGMQQAMQLEAMAGQQRQQQIAQQAQMMWSMLQAKGAKPLSWGSAPPGANAGMPPGGQQGITLNTPGGMNG